MEQRDQGSEPIGSEPPADDFGRAAAEASAEAAEADDGSSPGGLGHGHGHDDRDGYDGPGGFGGFGSADDPAARGPRRWLVTVGVAVSALALAGTAVAIATHSAHGKSADTTENAAAARTADSPTPSDPSQTSGSTDGTAQTSGSSQTQSSTSQTSSSSSPTKPTTSSKPSASKTSSSPAPPVGTNEVDCENSSHSTPADEAAKFSGMTKATQKAFTTAQTAAKAAGVTLVLNSGYRSAAYQERIFECWVNELGSTQAARQYALPPNESAHVMGYAMDIAPPSAASWLEDTKGEFGLCRRYADETWHFEYQASYKTKGCPALLAHP